MKTTAVSVYENDCPFWADRLDDDSIDIFVNEPAKLLPTHESNVLRVGGGLEPFFNGIHSANINAEIMLDVWVGQQGQAYVGHQLKSGDLLVSAVDWSFVKRILAMATAKGGIECVGCIKLWLEDCRMQRSKTLTEAFSGGSLYLHTFTGLKHAQEQLVWDAKPFIAH